MRIGLVIPHIFMHRDILPQVIFSPGTLALDLAAGLQAMGADVTLYTPGPVDTPARNVTADLSLFEAELSTRGDTYVDLLKKHPLTFITLARQVQSELVAEAFAAAARDELDIVHIYTNEEDIALPFVRFCPVPVALTHHDPFNFMARYRSVMPKYKHLNWLSVSNSQRSGMPPDTNWLATIYHGVAATRFKPAYAPPAPYLAFLGRIIEPKGLHLAIDAVRRYNESHSDKPYRLKIAGKHYGGHSKDTYWTERIVPRLNGQVIEYVGHISGTAGLQEFLSGAAALLMPSTFDEPFGMVGIEALACGTPVIGLNSGAIPEIISHRSTGYVVPKRTMRGFVRGVEQDILDEDSIVQNFSEAIARIPLINRRTCRAEFEKCFTLERMCASHLAAYRKITKRR